MKFIKSEIPDVYIIEPSVFGDDRGYFLESFNLEKFEENMFPIKFIQDNESKSSRGVLRGLHFQKPPYAQSKLVRCLKGKILDVALDLRKNSKTFGDFETIVLSSENKEQLFVPKGFAHGFIVLSESAIISYKVDNYYKPEFESGIIWNDPDLNIDWKINKTEFIISDKDTKLPTFNNFLSPFE